MNSQPWTDLGHTGMHMSTRFVKFFLFLSLLLHSLLQLCLTCHMLHTIPNATTAAYIGTTNAPVINDQRLNRGKYHRYDIQSGKTPSHKNAVTGHVPFMSQWYTKHTTSKTITTSDMSSPNPDRFNASATRREWRNQKKIRSMESKKRSESVRSDSTVNSLWSTLVINNPERHRPTSTMRLLDQKRTAQFPSFHSSSTDKEQTTIPNWQPWDITKDKEVSQFVIHLLSRYPTTVSPVQIYSIIYEWERYKHQKQLAMQRQLTVLVRQQMRRQRRLKEYNRHLRHFASILTQQHMNQVRKARTYHEFKQIMFDRNAADIDAKQVSKQSPASLPPSSLIGPPLQYPVPGQNIVAASSSTLQLPGGSGGGIVVSSLRSSRKGSTRESRAVSGLSESATENSINADTNKIKQQQISLKQSDAGITKSNGPSYHSPPDTEEEEPGYSEAELRSAFESYQEFRRTACQPHNQILCVRSLLELDQEHTTVVIPRGFHVRRCGSQIQPVCSYHAMPERSDMDVEDLDMTTLTSEGAAGVSNSGSTGSRFGAPVSDWYGYGSIGSSNEAEHLDYVMDRNKYTACDCETAEEECLPTNVTLKTQAVAVSRILPLQNLKHFTELIVVTEHTSCSCQPRCKNRRCVPPMKLVVHTFSDCACVCPSNDNRCQQLLEGIGQFTPDEFPLPLNGSYILPPCRYGPMDDVHLYHRRCPRPIGRPMSRK